MFTISLTSGELPEINIHNCTSTQMDEAEKVGLREGLDYVTETITVRVGGIKLTLYGPRKGR